VAHFRDGGEKSKSDVNGNKMGKEMGQGEPGSGTVVRDDKDSSSETDDDEFEEAKEDEDTDSVEK
jgi:hypothetical protein